MGVIHHPIQKLSVEVITADATAGLAMLRTGAIAGAGATNILGPVYVDTAVGSMCPVGVLGTFPAISGAAIAQGAYLTSDAAGKWVTATPVVGDAATGAAVPTNARGRACFAVAAADTEFEMEVI